MPFKIYGEQEFTDALFPWFEPSTAPANAQGLRVLLVSGAPIREPVAWYGPIVMNTEQELRQALADLRSGTFIKET